VTIPQFDAFWEACPLYLSSASCDSVWIIFISLNHILYNAILNSGTKELTWHWIWRSERVWNDFFLKPNFTHRVKKLVHFHGGETNPRIP
jgi:hypothetical protein